MLPSELDYYADKDTDLNYAALALAVWGENYVSPDYALSKIILGTGRVVRTKSERDAETLEMVRMADEGWSYTTIAKRMGIKVPTVWYRINRWKEKGHD